MANITKVYLLNVPIEDDYKHTFYFSSQAEQQAYFQGRLVKSFTDFSYQRKDNLIRIPQVYEDIMHCNYVMYQNTAKSNKWFYAFIKDMRYVNDGMTEVIIETDVIQTWLFDYTVKPSFIEREHVLSDELGEHTTPEQLETGDYICNSHNKAGYTDETDMMIVLGATTNSAGDSVTGNYYNNIYSGIKYYCYENNSEGIKVLNNTLKNYSSGHADAIVCLFLAPKKLGWNEGNEVVYTNTVDTEYINHSSGGEINTLLSLTSNKCDGYEPRNKKLLSFPYRYLHASNNNGASAIYKYEQFYTKDGNTKTMQPPMFTIEGCLTPGCSVRLIPDNYNGATRNDEEGLNLGKFPTLNWTSDMFTNWLTQNAVNIGVSTTSNILQMAFGGGFGIASGLGGIASTIGEIYQHSFVPPQAEGNLNAGDVIAASGENDFHFYEMTIKREYANIIDNYFDMFGYKCGRVKLPNTNHRSRYWYTKTIDANIIGPIPTEDMAKIKKAYNEGITFWRNQTGFRSYVEKNDII